MRKSLKQRTWCIYIRPYQKNGEEKVYYTGQPKTTKTEGGQAQAVSLYGEGEGKPVDSTMPYDKGGWVMWYKTNSFNLLREKYTELLKSCPREHTRVMELVEVDLLVTPLS